MAKAATMMTDTEYSMRVLGSAWPGHIEQDGRRDDAREHRDRSACRSGAEADQRAGQARCSAR